MIYIGIDPGLTGAVAHINGFDGGADVFDTPSFRVKSGTKTRGEFDRQTMVALLRVYEDEACHAVIESGIAMPGQSSFSVANIFEGIGVWKGILATLGIPFEVVQAALWKRQFGLIGKDKNASILRAKELFPTANIHLKKHHGRAEALLLAEYLRRKIAWKELGTPSLPPADTPEPTVKIPE